MALVEISQPGLTVVGLRQAVVEEIPCHLIDLIEPLTLLVAGHVFSRPFYGGQGDMGPFCQAFDGFAKGKVFLLHNELEDITVGVAAEAIKKSLVGGNAERGGLFIMERAAGPEIAALTLQRDIIGNDADNVIGLTDLFDKFAGKPFH